LFGGVVSLVRPPIQLFIDQEIGGSSSYAAHNLPQLRNGKRELPFELAVTLAKFYDVSLCLPR
jgi:hypothetical protein